MYFVSTLDMRLVGLSIAWALGLGLASAQTLSGLSFDGQDVVKLMWAFDGQSSGSYDFYLCAGDETGSYVSIANRAEKSKQRRES